MSVESAPGGQGYDVSEAAVVRQSSEREDALENFANGLLPANVDDRLEVVLTEAVPTACVVEASEQALKRDGMTDLETKQAERLAARIDAEYAIFVTTTPAPLEKTMSSDQLTADIVMQYGLVLHEVLHVLMTASGPCRDLLDAFVDEDYQDVVFNLFNIAEDAGIEREAVVGDGFSSQAAAYLYENRRLLSQSVDEIDGTVEVTASAAVKKSLYDQFFETGFTESIRDPDDGRLTFTDEDEREAFEAVVDAIESYADEILSLRSGTDGLYEYDLAVSVERIDRTIQLWQDHLKPLYEDADADDPSAPSMESSGGEEPDDREEGAGGRDNDQVPGQCSEQQSAEEYPSIRDADIDSLDEDALETADSIDDLDVGQSSASEDGESPGDNDDPSSQETDETGGENESGGGVEEENADGDEQADSEGGKGDSGRSSNARDEPDAERDSDHSSAETGSVTVEAETDSPSVDGQNGRQGSGSAGEAQSGLSDFLNSGGKASPSESGSGEEKGPESENQDSQSDGTDENHSDDDENVEDGKGSQDHEPSNAGDTEPVREGGDNDEEPAPSGTEGAEGDGENSPVGGSERDEDGDEAPESVYEDVEVNEEDLDEKRSQAKREAHDEAPDCEQVNTELENIDREMAGGEDGGDSHSQQSGAGAGSGELGELEVVDPLEGGEGQPTATTWDDIAEGAQRVGRELEKSLRVDKRTGKRRGQTSGSFERSSGYKLSLGDTRVFSRDNPGNEKDYLAVLVLDRSGSMNSFSGGGKIGTATKAVAMFAEAAESLGIEVAVVEFVDDEARLAKPASVEMEVASDALLHEQTGGGTPLTDALELARAVCRANRAEPLIITMTDGKPADVDDVKEQIRESVAPICSLTIATDRQPGHLPDKAEELEPHFVRTATVFDSKNLLRRLDEFASLLVGL